MENKKHNVNFASETDSLIAKKEVHESIKKLSIKRELIDDELVQKINKIDVAIKTIENLLSNANGASFVDAAIKSIVDSCIDVELDAKVKKVPEVKLKAVLPKLRNITTKKPLEITSVVPKKTKQDIVMLAIVDILSDGSSLASGDIMKQLAKRKIVLTAPNLSGYLTKFSEKFCLKKVGKMWTKA